MVSIGNIIQIKGGHYMDNKTNKFHKKYPFVESIIIFLLGISQGIVINLFTTDLAASRADNNWRVVYSPYLWIGIILVVFSIVYYWKFSAFSLSRQTVESPQKAADTLIEAITTETKKQIEGDGAISFEHKIIFMQKTVQVIKEIDEELLRRQR
jgi:hypothetical protein